MPNYEYLAVDTTGNEITGALEASTEAEAIGLLRNDGIYPTQIVQQGKGKLKRSKSSAKKGKRSTKSLFAGSGKVKSKSLMIYTRQLATLIESGLPLLRGLNVLGKQEPQPTLRKTIGQLADGVQSGSTFSESLAGHPKIFNKLYINMVKAGELGGVLELVLARLADYQEKAQKLKNKIVAAMVYPVIVMVIAAAITVFLMVFIVPRFKKIFEDMLPGRGMPALTQFVINFSQNLNTYKFHIIGGLLLIFILYKIVAATKGGHFFIDNFKLRMPLFGDIQRKSSISRFTRTLGTLVTSGVPILQAINITKETAGNVVIAKAISQVHDSVKEGESVVAPLEASKVFPPMVISMVDVGEETGQLPEMLMKISDVYDDEVDNSVTALTSLLEPLMIVFLAVVVGTIVLALFLPLIDIIKGLQGDF